MAIVDFLPSREPTLALPNSGSVDCNIPLLLGVAAFCIGTDIHEKLHTREEMIDKNPSKLDLRSQ